MVRYVRSRLGKIKVWYDLSMVHYLRQVTEFPLPSRIANALIRFPLTVPVHASRIGHTLVTPLPSPPNPTATDPWLYAIPLNTLLAFCLITEWTSPTWLAQAVSRTRTSSVPASFLGCTFLTAFPLPALAARANSWRWTMAASPCLTIFWTGCYRAKGATPTFFTSAFKALGTVAMLASG